MVVEFFPQMKRVASLFTSDFFTIIFSFARRINRPPPLRGSQKNYRVFSIATPMGRS